MSLDRELWQRIAPHFDQLAPMTPAEREDYLVTADLDERARAALRQLLDAHDSADEDPLDRSAPERLSLTAETPPGTDWTGRSVGPWAVAERLAEGGMSVVYRGHRADGQFEKEVAIKVLRAERFGADPERLVQEVRILARLEHPGIARLIDAGAADGETYLVMEFVRGQRIDRACDERGLDTRARVELLIEIAAALEYAHQRQIIHCDIKPSNILLRRDGRPCIVDFGIASVLSGDVLSQSDAGHFWSPGYAAPERLAGTTPDTRQDVYSVGAVLERLLTGRSPLHRPRVGREHEPDADRRLPRDLRAIIDRACAETPTTRYPSMGALRADLEAWRDHRPVAARGGGRAYVLGRWLRRHALAAMLGTLALLSMAVGTLVSLEQARTAQQEAARATAAKDFLVEIFLAADPTTQDGDDPSASELLRRGAERIGNELNDQPMLQAELLQVIGYAQHERGLFDDARISLDRALTLFERFPAHRARPVALADRAMVAFQNGEVDAAIEWLERALALAEERRLSIDQRTMIASRLAGQYLQRREGERALAITEPLLARDDIAPEWRAYALRNRGAALELLQRYDESIEALNEALRIQRELDPDHVFISQVLNELGITYSSMGRNAEALAAFDASYEHKVRVYGPNHPQSQATLRNRAAMQARLGEFAAAAESYRITRAAHRANFGDDLHPRLALIDGMIAWLRLRADGPAVAEAPARAALDMLRALPADPEQLARWIEPLNAIIALELGRPVDDELLGTYAEECHALDHNRDLGRRICLARAWQAIEVAGECPDSMPPSISKETLAGLPPDWQGVYRAVLERCGAEPAALDGLPPPPAWLTGAAP